MKDETCLESRLADGEKSGERTGNTDGSGQQAGDGHESGELAGIGNSAGKLAGAGQRVRQGRWFKGLFGGRRMGLISIKLGSLRV